MSSSDQRIEAGAIISGSLGKYRLREVVGKGGNGIVFSADLVESFGDIPYEKGYAVKILDVAHKCSREECIKRKKRFIREIRCVQTIQSNINGILPIYDASANSIDNEEPYWYLMPLASKYYSKKPLHLLLEDTITIGKTIEKIHRKNLVHRDIKPGNLLLYRGRIVLSDFGLVWTDNDDSITGIGDHIGPILIRPPEMDPIQRGSDHGNRKSDVYLYAKTIWCLITKNRMGFWGEYTRGNKRLHINEYIREPVDSLEPLNILFERATYNSPDKRISISDCIALIESQLRIIKKDASPHEISAYKYDELINEVRHQGNPSKMIYTDETEIQRLLRGSTNIVELIVDDFDIETSLGKLVSVSSNGDKEYVLDTVRAPVPRTAKSNSYIVQVEHAEIHNDNNECTLQLRAIDEVNNNDFWHYPETIVEMTGKTQAISRPVKMHLRKIQY